MTSIRDHTFHLDSPGKYVMESTGVPNVTKHVEHLLFPYSPLGVGLLGVPLVFSVYIAIFSTYSLVHSLVCMPVPQDPIHMELTHTHKHTHTQPLSLERGGISSPSGGFDQDFLALIK